MCPQRRPWHLMRKAKRKDMTHYNVKNTCRYYYLNLDIKWHNQIRFGQNGIFSYTCTFCVLEIYTLDAWQPVHQCCTKYKCFHSKPMSTHAIKNCVWYVTNYFSNVRMSPSSLNNQVDHANLTTWNFTISNFPLVAFKNVKDRAQEVTLFSFLLINISSIGNTINYLKTWLSLNQRSYQSMKAHDLCVIFWPSITAFPSRHVFFD